jgi:uncharacterized protein
MKLSLESGQDDFQIRGYGREGIRVGERTLTRSFILSARGLIEDWPPVNRHTLRPEHLQTMVDLAPEVVIIGIGERLEFPPPEVLRPIVDLNVGVEVMSTDAACRTYNVLHGEDRHVVAGFLIET